jgi:undecaprenyl-diphosphatase
MSLLEAIIIAIVEGLTEFLPVSSTGHMVIASSLMGMKPDTFTKLFEIVIQLAAIISVVVLYWKKFFDVKKFSFYIKLIIAVIPALLMGALLKKHIENMLESPVIIAIILLLGGIVLIFVDNWFKKPLIDKEENISNKNAFVIGCFQVLSVLFPGLSRSAATIIGGMQQKLTRKVAAEFSFFLAVPTMLAASVKSLWDVYQESPEVLSSSNISTLAIGSIVAFIVALLSIKFLIGFLQKHGFKLFGYYRIIIGVLLLILFYTGIVKV